MSQETLYFFDSFERTYSFRLEVDEETFEKVKSALEPLGIGFRSPRRENYFFSKTCFISSYSDLEISPLANRNCKCART
jgi:hypothetical protein